MVTWQTKAKAKEASYVFLGKLKQEDCRHRVRRLLFGVDPLYCFSFFSVRTQLF
jgi:hypothetical protein